MPVIYSQGLSFHTLIFRFGCASCARWWWPILIWILPWCGPNPAPVLAVWSGRATKNVIGWCGIGGCTIGMILKAWRECRSSGRPASSCDSASQEPSIGPLWLHLFRWVRPAFVFRGLLLPYLIFPWNLAFPSCDTASLPLPLSAWPTASSTSPDATAPSIGSIPWRVGHLPNAGITVLISNAKKRSYSLLVLVVLFASKGPIVTKGTIFVILPFLSAILAICIQIA